MKILHFGMLPMPEAEQQWCFERGATEIVHAGHHRDQNQAMAALDAVRPAIVTVAQPGFALEAVRSYVDASGQRPQLWVRRSDETRSQSRPWDPSWDFTHFELA